MNAEIAYDAAAAAIDKAAADEAAQDAEAAADKAVVDDAKATAGSSLAGIDDAKRAQASKTVQGAWTRLWGQDALKTMEEVVGTGFNRAVTVVIATNAGFWDALSASALAGLYSAPILLTDPNKLSSETESEIKRLGAYQAFICGGEKAISETVLKAVDKLGLSTERIWGNTAADTAIAIAERMGTDLGKTAIVATVDSYHDALSIAPWAYAYRAPVFLTTPRGLDLSRETYAALAESGFNRVIIPGGTEAVSANVERRIRAINGIRTVTRLGGANAYGTSAEVAAWGIQNGLSANNMGVATGTGYWDALTGAAFCGKNKSVLVLVDDNNTSAVTAFINKNRSKIQKGYVFGGTAAVGSFAMATVVSGTVASVYSTLTNVNLAGHTKVGIDVSVWNGNIDWSRVKASGVDFAIVRVGYGTDSTDQDDTRYLENIRGAKAAGVPLGVYLYSYGRNTTNAASEAAHTLRLLNAAGLKPADVPYGVYYDLEENSMASVNNRDLLAQMATTYCTAIANAGYTPGVYANLNWWDNYLTSPLFNQWQRWVAQFNSRCDYQGSYVMWQCKSTGSVPGISGNVDMNLYYK